MARTRNYREHLEEVLKDDEEAVAYLNAALAEEDPEVFLLALRDVAGAREGGLAALAEAAHLNREHLYRMLSENGNPELRSLEALLDALGFRLSVELKATG
jgi:probable addiction module antidote protein